MTPPAPIRLAVWSGPRNISTALMRSWGNRPDTCVTDEPLYAHYLSVTRAPHPGIDEVIAHHEPDWRKVVGWLTGPVPEGRPIWYQKHMAHHLLPNIDRAWLAEVSNAFLIRDPREMLTSLIKITPNPHIADTGLPQQVEIFEATRQRTGNVPPVVDAQDVLEDPRGVLSAFCAAVGVPFTEAMLSWPPGPRATDGIWAKHWYAEVEKTTAFRPFRPKPDAVPCALEGLHAECQELYRRLHQHRLRGS